MTQNGMSIVRTLCLSIEKSMAWLILSLALLALWQPACGLWMETAWITPLLTAVMFGMGLTLRAADFRHILLHPRNVLIGCAAQFTIMPLLAWGLCCLFAPDPAIAAGIILVGTCPGGTASNVITFLAKGDVPLSVSMTTVNTLLAPLLTPLITWLILRTTVEVDTWGMFLSILQVIMLPLAGGFLLQQFCGGFVKRLLPYLPTFSILAICTIIVCVIAHNAGAIQAAGFILLLPVIAHNLLGFACGYGVGKALRLPAAQCKTMAIEIGMQNSGLAVALAHSAFSHLPAAAVPGALFSVWHNISGGMLAALFKRRGEKESV